MTKKKALGKGLGALLENVETDFHGGLSVPSSTSSTGMIDEVQIEDIEVNPFQPRIDFDENALSELAASIAEHGIIQPITLRKSGRNQFQIISGERRFRASQLAGLKSIPAYVRDANDQTMLEMALVENIQREDLNAIEVAISYHRLIDECELTQEELGQRVGKKRSTVTNYLRLLKLEAEIQLALKDKKISMGHARALLGLENKAERIALFHRILNEELSVRKVESIIKGKAANEQQFKSKIILTPIEERIKDELSSLLDSNVKIRSTVDGKGKIEISYQNQSELRRIAEKLNY
ncbi:MAG: ParB/RepB/Spo0J family partition protein [Bacteroidota bacterium]